MVATSPARAFPTELERIGLDTNIFIYLLEDHPKYAPWCASLFNRMNVGKIRP